MKTTKIDDVKGKRIKILERALELLIESLDGCPIENVVDCPECADKLDKEKKDCKIEAKDYFIGRATCEINREEQNEQR
jgi:hypothetical protein